MKTRTGPVEQRRGSPAVLRALGGVEGHFGAPHVMR